MELRVERSGRIVGLYDEVIDLTTLGMLRIRRASQVEPDAQGQWWADLAPLRGPRLGPFGCRSQAMQAERAWLRDHVVMNRPSS
jgi:hypothetical protein